MVTIIAAIVVFGIIVLVHEWGHFVTAKMTGMRVDEFAIGFGPKLFGWQKGETRYSLRCVPLGGFNDIAGMTKEADEESDYGPAGERAYYRRPIPHRMLVIVAGSVMNLLTPILLFWGLFFFVGLEEPINEPVIGQVVEEMPAAKAGILAGDRIIAIDGNSIDSWKDITENMKAGSQAGHKITYQREGTENTVDVAAVERDGRWVIGITSATEHYSPGFFESIGLAIEHNFSIIGRMIESLAGMITGSTPAGDVSGPIGVLQMTGKAAEMGIIPLINFTAMLSLNLGIINLLPIPMLDGGHFVALCIEGLRGGKQMSAKVMYVVQGIGLALLISLMVYATINDLTR